MTAIRPGADSYAGRAGHDKNENGTPSFWTYSIGARKKVGPDTPHNAYSTPLNGIAPGGMASREVLAS